MLPVPLPQPFLDVSTTPTRPFSPTTLGLPGSGQVMGRGPARAPYLFGLLLPSLLLGEELQMELLLLLLVIFLQLEGGGGWQEAGIGVGVGYLWQRTADPRATPALW